MSEGEDGVQDNVAESAESVESGEVTETTGTSTETTGESETTASSEKGTTGSDGLFDGMDGATLHKSYKSLQGEYTKVNETIKRLERFGGVDQMAQWADYLQNNPRFAEWVKAEQSSKATGINRDEMDDQTKDAYDMVQKIADNASDTKVRQILQEHIIPIQEAYKKQLLQGHFDAMDTKYGSDWQEMREKMSDLSAELSDKIKNKPELEDIEDLYFKALRKSGKFDAYAAKQHQKQLTVKKAKATDKPGSALPSGPKQYKTIQEAAEAAKQSLGV